MRVHAFFFFFFFLVVVRERDREKYDKREGKKEKKISVSMFSVEDVVHVMNLLDKQ